MFFHFFLLFNRFRIIRSFFQRTWEVDLKCCNSHNTFTSFFFFPQYWLWRDLWWWRTVPSLISLVRVRKKSRFSFSVLVFALTFFITIETVFSRNRRNWFKMPQFSHYFRKFFCCNIDYGAICGDEELLQVWNLFVKVVKRSELW